MHEERTISYAIRVVFPKEIDVDKGFSECCYDNIALASSSDTDPYKNDFYGVYHVRQLSSEVCDIVLLKDSVEYPITDNTFGEYIDFGGVQDNDVYKHFICDWRKVLIALGQGNYSIRKDITIAGQTFSISSNTFTLREYSISNAHYTVRIDSYMNDFLVKNNVNFNKTGFKTSLRVRGYFGDPQAVFSKTSKIVGTYQQKDYQKTIDKEYVFEGDNLPECISSEIVYFMLLGDVFINDYNTNNHQYDLIDIGVTVKENAGNGYAIFNRNTSLNITFEDNDKSNIRRYKN